MKANDARIGRNGEVVVALTPFGMVRLDGEEGKRGKEYSAKSTGLPIEVGTTVAVVKAEAFGLVVKEFSEEGDQAGTGAGPVEPKN